MSVEQPFAVPLIDPETGEVLERDLVGTWDMLERDAEGFVVVDLKTSGRKYSDLQVEASLQLSIYNYAVGLSPLANGRNVRLRFDVLTKTKEPELHRHWTTRDRAANVRLFRLAAEVLAAIESWRPAPEAAPDATPPDPGALVEGRVLDAAIASRVRVAESCEVLALVRRGLRRDDAYRLVHAEGDDLSGLVVDRLGSVLVVEYHALGFFRWRDELARILERIHPGFAVHHRVPPGAARDRISDTASTAS